MNGERRTRPPNGSSSDEPTGAAGSRGSTPDSATPAIGLGVERFRVGVFRHDL
jgi:hypothetical protein